jgi:hypothetical protein
MYEGISDFLTVYYFIPIQTVLSLVKSEHMETVYSIHGQ